MSAAHSTTHLVQQFEKKLAIEFESLNHWLLAGFESALRGETVALQKLLAIDSRHSSPRPAKSKSNGLTLRCNDSNGFLNGVDAVKGKHPYLSQEDITIELDYRLNGDSPDSPLSAVGFAKGANNNRAPDRCIPDVPLEAETDTPLKQEPQSDRATLMPGSRSHSSFLSSPPSGCSSPTPSKRAPSRFLPANAKPHNILDHTFSQSYEGDTPYSEEETQIMEDMRHQPGGRWFVLMISMMDIEEGFHETKGDEDECLELCEAWTSLTRVSDPWRISVKEEGGQADDSLTVKDRVSDVLRSDGILQSLVIRPQSFIRVPWLLFGGLLILMDLLCIPLRLVDLAGDNDERVSRVILVYWFFDLFFNFFQGYNKSDGRVELRLSEIRRTYFKSWFVPDIFAVTVDVVITALQVVDDTSQAAKEGSKAFRMARILRLLRLVKLLRIRKLTALIKEFFNDIRSDWVMLVAKIVEHLMYILVINHFIACMWYGLSSMSNDEDRWLVYFEVEGKSDFYKYIVSLHWSLTQFTPSTMNIAPRNASERTFAVVVVVFALVSFSSFVSGVTNAVNELRTMNAGMTTDGARIRAYLAKKKVSTRLGSRIMHFFQTNYRRTKVANESDIVFFKYFPQSLTVAMHCEIYHPVLISHPVLGLFEPFAEDVGVRLCHLAFSDESYMPRQDIFISGDECSKVYCLLNGDVSYSTSDKGRVDVPVGSWVSDIALWFKWTHQGQLTAHNSTMVATIDCAIMRTIVVRHGGAFHACLKNYVAFLLGHLDQNDHHVCDVALSTDTNFQRSASQSACPQTAIAERAQQVWAISYKAATARSRPSTPEGTASGALLSRQITPAVF